MKIINLFLMANLIFAPGLLYASDLFHDDVKIQDGIDVHAVSDVFADIYEKLDSVNWAGKNVGVAIES
ncbi:MAG: hypothetical protein IK122_00485, partial [Alphaproteobacteria bacterium]|nr:hypothetical protein [Alphaproteobacteria bacterium]